jgi:DNA ligase-associated metallophosphoesterase
MNMSGGLDWEFKGQHLRLLPEKALFWKEEEALIVTDVHIGKVGHFRKAGIAIPKLLEQEDLALLSDIFREHQPAQAIFLGDLFHSEMNNDWGWLKLWRELFPEVKMILVKGNHDVLHDNDFLSAGFELHDQLCLGPFIFMHEPAERSCELYPVSGHIHPAVRLFGKGRQMLTLPCFYFGASQAILPAFGRFTGKTALKHTKKDTVFGIAEGRVLAL